jgi:hypothetical protein
VRTFKESGLRQNKNPDRAGIFRSTLQSQEAPHWTRRDATVIATLPNLPAEVIDAYSRNLSSESIKTAQAPVSPLVFVCVPTARRHTCKTMKSLSFGEMRTASGRPIGGQRRSVYRTFKLPHNGWRVLGSDLNRSESRCGAPVPRAFHPD